jgi:hypothetical protein
MLNIIDCEPEEAPERPPMITEYSLVEVRVSCLINYNLPCLGKKFFHLLKFSLQNQWNIKIFTFRFDSKSI